MDTFEEGPPKHNSRRPTFEEGPTLDAGPTLEEGPHTHISEEAPFLRGGLLFEGSGDLFFSSVVFFTRK